MKANARRRRRDVAYSCVHNVTSARPPIGRSVVVSITLRRAQQLRRYTYTRTQRRTYKQRYEIMRISPPSRPSTLIFSPNEYDRVLVRQSISSEWIRTYAYIEMKTFSKTRWDEIRAHENARLRILRFFNLFASARCSCRVFFQYKMTNTIRTRAIVNATKKNPRCRHFFTYVSERGTGRRALCR